MIDRDHELPVTHQAKVLDISRGKAYYKPQPVSPKDQATWGKYSDSYNYSPPGEI
jgi:hypothetical protein